MRTLVVKDKELVMDDDLYEFLKDKTHALSIKRNYPALILHRIFHRPTSEQPFVDHINRNRLDFRRANLRLASRVQNSANRNPISRKKSSQFRGVYPQSSGVWTAHIFNNKTQRAITLGSFSSEKTAARAYDLAAIYFHGEYAGLNFPQSTYSAIDPIDELRILLSSPNVHSKCSDFIGVGLNHKSIKNPWTAYAAGTKKNFRTALEAALWRDEYLRAHSLLTQGKYKLNFPTNAEIVEFLNLPRKNPHHETRTRI